MEILAQVAKLGLADELDGITAVQLEKLFSSAWYADEKSGAAYAALWAAFVACSQEEAVPRAFSEWLGARALAMYQGRRAELVALLPLGEVAQWEALIAHRGVQCAFNSARRAAAQYGSGWSFAVSRRLTVAQFRAGDRAELVIVEPKAPVSPKGETAKAKGIKRQAKGAKIENPVQGASALEAVSHSFEAAKNAVLECLRAHPRLTLSADIREAFSASLAAAEKAAAVAAARKAA